MRTIIKWIVLFLSLFILGRWIVFVSESYENRIESEINQLGLAEWERVEVLGDVGKFNFYFFIISGNSKTIKASWVTNGVSCEKSYDLGLNEYAVVSFNKEYGDSFAVVLKRPQVGETGSRKAKSDELKGSVH
jgi:hypothetical protein